MNELNPGDVLQEARQAVTDNEFATALDKYQWFYYNSIKIERSYYGVRLSYCLFEWARLGQSYPAAMQALNSLKNNTLDNFRESSSRESFHEFSAIVRALETPEEAFDVFIQVHETNKELAVKLFTFVYEYCAAKKYWGLCREYIGNGYKQYKEAIESFDHLMEFAHSREEEHGELMRSQAITAIKNDVLWILNMLIHVNEKEEYESALSRIEADLKSRDANDIYNDILMQLSDK